MTYFKYDYTQGDISFSSYIYRVSTYHYNWHPEIELLIVLKGSVEVCHDSEYTMLRKDDAIIYSSQCGHATLALEEDTTALVIHFDPEFFLGFDKDFMKYRFCFYSHEGNKHDEFYQNIRRLAAQLMMMPKEDSLDRLRVSRDFMTLAELVYGKIESVRYEVRGATVANTQEATFAKMIAYIDEHYHGKLELSHIAKIGGYSESYASQFFKRQLGISFMEYVLRMRLRDAASRLANTDDQVLTIANLCGFSDVKAFNVAFKKYFHTTPTEYRSRASHISRKTMLEDWKEYISSDEGDIQDILEQYRGDRTHHALHAYAENTDAKVLQELKQGLQELIHKIP